MLPPFVVKGPIGWIGDQLKAGCALEAGAPRTTSAWRTNPRSRPAPRTRWRAARRSQAGAWRRYLDAKRLIPLPRFRRNFFSAGRSDAYKVICDPFGNPLQVEGPDGQMYLLTS